MTLLRNGSMELMFVDAFKRGDRNAIVCRRGNHNYIVGKNYIMDGDEVSWSWGAYDFPDAISACQCAQAWVNG